MSLAIETCAWVSPSFLRHDDEATDQPARSQWIPLGQVGIGVNDVGFRQSAVAVERLRTYNGLVLELNPHLVRYRRTLDFLGIDLEIDEAVIADRIDELIDRNNAWCMAEKDFGITMLATPGDLLSGSYPDPLHIIHLNPLDHLKIEQQKTNGQPLVVTAVRQPAAECWPRDIKVRCRLHYYWADRQARQFANNAIGVLVDSDGSITETSVANLAIVVGGEIVSPPSKQVLPGITQDLAQRIASAHGITWRNETIYPAELRTADEVILMGTDGGIWFASRVDGHPIHNGRPGDIYQRLANGFDRYVRQHSSQ
jgi:branched-subunit amino acid aminotransferase/4-amino-4-deoxychorismate lyase